jgi:cell division protein FtsL
MIVRTFDIIVVAALLGSATWTFKVKNDSERAHERVAELERQIEREREAVDLLRADWSLLTSPDRLQALVERHREELGLETARPEQFVDIEEVPSRPLSSPEPDGSAVIEHADAAETGPDEISRILTGAIDQ